jgi:hypothetical protein
MGEPRPGIVGADEIYSASRPSRVRAPKSLERGLQFAPPEFDGIQVRGMFTGP